MVQFVPPPAPNYTAEHIGAGLAAFGKNAMLVRQMQDERARALREMELEDQDRATAAEDRARAIGERETESAFYGQQAAQANRPVIRSAAQQGFKQMGPAGAAAGAGAQIAGTERLERMISKMSPQAARMALGEVQRDAATDMVARSVPSWRSAVRNAVNTGALPPELADAYLKTLTPEAARANPEMALQTMAAAEDLITKKHLQDAQDEAAQIDWAIADQGIQETMQRALPQIRSMDPAKRAEALTEYRLLQRQWATLTPAQRSSRTGELIAMFENKPGKQPVSEMDELAETYRIRGRRATRVVPNPEYDRLSNPDAPRMIEEEYTEYPKTKAEEIKWAQQYLGMDTATRLNPQDLSAVMADERARNQGRGSYMQPLPGAEEETIGQMAPIEALRSSRTHEDQAAMLGATQPQQPPRSRGEYLSATKGGAKDLRETVARWIKQGRSAEDIGATLGIDMETLTEADLKAIERIVSGG